MNVFAFLAGVALVLNWPGPFRTTPSDPQVTKAYLAKIEHESFCGQAEPKVRWRGYRGEAESQTAFEARRIRYIKECPYP